MAVPEICTPVRIGNGQRPGLWSETGPYWIAPGLFTRMALEN
jgi:hypothetical protein